MLKNISMSVTNVGDKIIDDNLLIYMFDPAVLSPIYAKDKNPKSQSWGDQYQLSVIISTMSPIWRCQQHRCKNLTSLSRKKNLTFKNYFLRQKDGSL